MVRVLGRLLLVVLSLAVSSAVVRAADEHAGGDHTHIGGPQTPADQKLAEDPTEVSLDLATFTFVVFLLLLAILWKFAWGPISAALEKREHSIAEHIAATQRAYDEAKQTLAAHEAKLAGAAAEVRELIEEARRDAEVTKQQILAEAKSGADAERQRALRDIEAATDSALKSLAERSATLAVELAGKIVQSKLSADEHSRLIQDALARFPKAEPARNQRDPHMIDGVKNNGDESQAVDVGAQQVGATYAKALLSAAKKAGNLEQVAEDFRATIVEVLDKLPRLEHVLVSALIAPEEKLPLIERVFRGRVTPTFLNFLKVVATKGRLGALRSAYREFLKHYDEYRGIVRVKLTTASAISPQVQQSIQQTLRSMLDGEPVIDAQIDPALIGGLVLRVGDAVYDGSIARQLQQMREQMINRSVHEIQSGRNRFRSSG